jgi:outer membrane receptor protein involved in Fe transport
MPSPSLHSRIELRRCQLRRTPLAAAVAAALASAAVPTLVAAQDAAEEIEVFIVSATRRDESIQEVPLNIAAFDGGTLEEREIGDLAELGRNVPGMYVVDQGKRTSNRIVVRGLNLATVSSSEGIGNNAGGTVATYVGEIPMYIDLGLHDIDRVEVLLGPQGTLYGAGTLGGAIRYMPRRPELDETTLSFRAATFDVTEGDMGVRGGVTANFPIGDSFALRFNVDLYDDPGFIDTPYLVRESGVSDPEPDFTNPADVSANLYGAEDVNTEETLFGRVGVRWAPVGGAVDANFTYYFQDMEVGGRTQNNVVSFGTGPYQSSTRYPEPNDRENQLFAAEITADLGFASLTSATGFGKYEELGQRDQTDFLITLEYYYELFPSFSAFTREIQDDDQFSQEIRLVSQGDGRVSWIGGLFYQTYDTFGESREFTPHYDEYLVNAGFGSDLRPDSLEYISQLYEDLEEKAIFGEIGINITDSWQVTFGARYYDYTYETLSGIALPLFDTVFGGDPPDSINLTLEPNGQSDSGSLFKVNTSYQFSDNAMAYITISEGYDFGASNGVGPCPDPVPPNFQNVCALPNEIQYFSQTTTNHEIGLRSQWLDQRLTFNAALYYIDWQDPQLPSTTVNGAQPITKNGEGAESQGFEISLDALVTDRFSVGLTYSHVSAELSDVAPNVLREFTPPGFGPGAGYDGLDAVYVDGQPGDRLPGSPEDQLTFSLGYSVALDGGSILDFNYHVASIGDVITKIGNRAGGETLSSYDVHSASATLSRGAWTVGLYAQNLTDEEAVTGVRAIRDWVQTVADENGAPVRMRGYANEVLRPREVGLKFTYDFDFE